MSKKIAVTLTEDQLRALLDLIMSDETYDGDGNKAAKDYNAFMDRLYDKLASQLAKI